MKKLLFALTPCLFFATAAFAQTGGDKLDAALAAKVKQFKAQQTDPDGSTTTEEYVAVIVRHESAQTDDDLSRMVAAKKGKLKKHMASLRMSFVDLPVSQLESLAAEPGVKRISFDGSVATGQ